jgi:hypothetical protein
MHFESREMHLEWLEIDFERLSGHFGRSASDLLRSDVLSRGRPRWAVVGLALAKQR